MLATNNTSMMSDVMVRQFEKLRNTTRIIIIENKLWNFKKKLLWKILIISNKRNFANLSYPQYHSGRQISQMIFSLHLRNTYIICVRIWPWTNYQQHMRYQNKHHISACRIYVPICECDVIPAFFFPVLLM